jgi:hypothetical protein
LLDCVALVSIECFTNDIYFGVLIPHRGFEVSVTHDSHHGFEVAGFCGNYRAEVMTTDTELVGTIELKNTVSLVAINQADRSKTQIVFFDIVDPKSFTAPFPEPLDISYTIKAIYKSDPGSKDPDKTLSMTLPVAVAPAQVPRLAAAGIALSDYIYKG